MTFPRHPLHPETTSISEGFDPTLSVMSVRPPIYPVSTYAFQSAEAAAHHFDVALGRASAAPGESMGLIYARLNNPNAEMFEDALHAVEQGAEAAAVFSSGMAAIATTLMAIARPGQKVLYQRPVYGGTDHFLHHVLPDWGVEAIAVRDGEWPAKLAQHAGAIAAVYLETPANPTLHMIDLAAVVGAVRALEATREVPIVVDNTFLGPVFQSPLRFGVDLVVYSATKFLGGHSDLVAGALTGRSRALVDRVKTLRSFLGTICEPFTAWMLQRSMATLHLRMIKQSKNAAKIVAALREHPAIATLHYPTLLSGDQERVFRAQCTAPGSMVALELHGGREAAFRFLNALGIVRLAVSLGGVESLACHPRTTTASEMSEEDLRESGVTEGLVRLSIGVEYWRDLLADIVGGLAAASRAPSAQAG